MDLFRRHENNPILTINDLPFPAIGVYNPGVAEVNGKVLLLLRVEKPDGRSCLYVAWSKDGVNDWHVEKEPFLAPGDPEHPHEELGCEDPRLTYIEELDEWVIAYVAASRVGPGVALAQTKDFRRATRIGLVFPPPNKDAALFPRRINGKWMMLHRPVSGSIEHVWLAESPDLIHWGHSQIVLQERGGTWWDGAKIGAGPPPIETPEGWLLIYHGVKIIAGAMSYRLGVALLDLDDPTRVVARCQYPVFGPIADYERIGNGFNIVFPCGALVRENNEGEKEVWLYYGAADTCVALAIARLNDLISCAWEGGV